MKPGLPEPLPDDPLPLLDAWIDEARTEIRNATAMTLATVDARRAAVGAHGHLSRVRPHRRVARLLHRP